MVPLQICLFFPVWAPNRLFPAGLGTGLAAHSTSLHPWASLALLSAAAGHLVWNGLEQLLCQPGLPGRELIPLYSRTGIQAGRAGSGCCSWGHCWKLSISLLLPCATAHTDSKEPGINSSTGLKTSDFFWAGKLKDSGLSQHIVRWAFGQISYRHSPHKPWFFVSENSVSQKKQTNSLKQRNTCTPLSKSPLDYILKYLIWNPEFIFPWLKTIAFLNLNIWEWH